ncbi:hypothetical protein BDN72DRAFT_959473 [Pluteus cervinus]|uniref:Uncharacterized protein n=1 Tax=Pluteus cervinus TaxID=181527 RepID=A0ACD3AVL6_9AGAR|nr:hypothetical protein BDN72DRAFT_959473 [Pluteus cervinus]
MDSLNNLKIDDNQPIPQSSAPAPTPSSSHPPPKHEQLLGKLSGALGGPHPQNLPTQAPPPPPPVPESKHEQLLNTLSSALGNKPVATPPPPPRPEGLLGMLSEVIAPTSPPKKEEAKADSLDEALDWVQRHIFHQGAQHNESAFEQAKDEKIAETIRHE